MLRKKHIPVSMTVIPLSTTVIPLSATEAGGLEALPSCTITFQQQEVKKGPSKDFSSLRREKASELLLMLMSI